jgi:hypothetical protein
VEDVYAALVNQTADATGEVYPGASEALLREVEVVWRRLSRQTKSRHAGKNRSTTHSEGRRSSSCVAKDPQARQGRSVPSRFAGVRGRDGRRVQFRF